MFAGMSIILPRSCSSRDLYIRVVVIGKPNVMTSNDCSFKHSDFLIGNLHVIHLHSKQLL